MKEISNELKRYLERELKDYTNNKRDLEILKLDIIEESPKIDLGVPSSPNKGNECQTSKVYRIMTDRQIKRIENMCYHIERILSMLNDAQYEFYVRYFEKGQSKVKICIEMPISEATFHRYKNKIIILLARELDFI